MIQYLVKKALNANQHFMCYDIIEIKQKKFTDIKCQQIICILQELQINE